MFTVFVGVAVRILYLLTLFYMHIFHLHREGQLSVIESIFKYNRNVLTVVQASSNVIQWIKRSGRVWWLLKHTENMI